MLTFIIPGSVLFLILMILLSRIESSSLSLYRKEDKAEAARRKILSRRDYLINQNLLLFDTYKDALDIEKKILVKMLRNNLKLEKLQIIENEYNTDYDSYDKD